MVAFTEIVKRGLNMDKHRSQGENMHFTYLKMPDGEQRRHKSRCIHLQANDYCVSRGMRCCGSSLCAEHYKEKAENLSGVDCSKSEQPQQNLAKKKYNSVDFNKQIKDILKNSKYF